MCWSQSCGDRPFYSFFPITSGGVGMGIVHKPFVRVFMLEVIFGYKWKQCTIWSQKTWIPVVIHLRFVNLREGLNFFSHL